jgi:diguanylate cyclase (GGDEF)-like protein/PAS domain S-box-containing protein
MGRLIDGLRALSRGARSFRRGLKESEQRLRGLAALSSDWYWEQDSNFRFTLVSSGVRDKSGEAFDAWVGKTLWELPYENVDWTEHRAMLAQHRPFRGLQLQPITADASAVYISVSGEPRFEADGTFSGYRGIAKDVTERVRSIDDLQRFQAMDAISDAIFLIDRASLRLVHVNDAGCRLRQLTREQILALEPWNVWGEMSGSRAQLERTYDGLIAGGAPAAPQEFLWRPEQGPQIWLDVRRHAQCLRGRWTIIILVRDITERKQAEDKLRRLNRLYAMVSGVNVLVVRARDRDELFRNACRIAVEQGEFDKAWVGIVDRTRSNVAVVASAGMDESFLAAIKDLFGSSAGALSGNTLTAGAIRDKTVAISNDLQNDQRVAFNKKYAAMGIHSLAVFPLIVSDDAVGVIVLYTRKIELFDEQGLKMLTELAGNIAFAIDYIDKQERLDYLAYYDALTGLANRRLFLDRLAQYLRSAANGQHKLGLFLVDLERFKSVNDSLGRPAGDSLLRQVAQWLTHFAGDATLLARVAADQFAIVMPEIRQDGDLVRLLEKTIAIFQNHPFSLNDAVYRIAAKIGIVLFPDDGSDVDTLFKHAEAALKKAKAAGDRYLFYSQRMSETMSGRLGLENQLRQALDNEEFVLHYQPKFDLVSGRLTGAEGLIRWNRPETGMVAPGRFIPILEQTGLIHEVGRWALRNAVAQYLRWLNTGLLAVPIAVNVSPLQLRHRGFLAEIEQAINIDAHAAAGLELEITESLIMEDVNHSIASLQAIRAMGIGIAIDDFGTGFSSLSYLSKLPVDTLKIDRSFVLDMASAPGGATLVSVIIDLAHALKLKAVAEGVETQEQLRQLRALNCDQMQGYLCGKPVAGEVFESQYLASSGSQVSQILA